MALMTIEELAEYLKVSVWTVGRLVRSGRIPYIRVGRQLRFDPEAVRAALTVQQSAEPPRRRPGELPEEALTHMERVLRKMGVGR